MLGSIAVGLSLAYVLLSDPMHGSAMAGSEVKSAPTDVILRLHRAYANHDTSYIDQLMIASKLARLGDRTFWRRVRKDAEKAINHGQEHPRSRFAIHVGRWRTYDPKINVEDSTSSPQTYNVKVDVRAEKNPVERERDIWRVFAFAAGASPGEKPLLRKGLSSTDGLVSCSAALGLARLHDVNSVADIKAASQRHPEELPVFVEALIYLHDANATRVALDLTDGDDSVIQSLAEMAEANRYDPFLTADDAQ